jgi:DNA repair protein RecO (recombination protein O)
MAGWQAAGIILSASRFGEGGLILSIFVAERGLRRGLARGAAKSRQRGLYEPGNQVTATWNARLAEQLGSFRVEPDRFVAAAFMDDALRLACLGAALSVADMALPEQAAHPASYAALMALLDALIEDESFLQLYLRFELVLLTELGFGLDLSRCALTGTTEDLAYVSPRTGKAASLQAGAIYRDRLLPLPRMLGGVIEAANEIEDLLAGLRISGHFLERHVLEAKGPALSAARQLFIDRLRRGNLD